MNFLHYSIYEFCNSMSFKPDRVVNLGCLLILVAFLWYFSKVMFEYIKLTSYNSVINILCSLFAFTSSCILT